MCDLILEKERRGGINEMCETNLFVVVVKQPCAGGFLYLSIHHLAEQKGIGKNEEIQRESERRKIVVFPNPIRFKG